MSNYDEDIYENPFFQCLLSHLSSFEDVSAILVPQKKSLPAKFEIPADLKSHIVIEKSENEFLTQNGHEIHIKDKMVFLNGGDLQVPILFSETHYGQDWEKVKIFCIKRPLTETSFEFQESLDEGEKY